MWQPYGRLLFNLDREGVGKYLNAMKKNVGVKQGTKDSYFIPVCVLKARELESLERYPTVSLGQLPGMFLFLNASCSVYITFSVVSTYYFHN